MTTSTRQPNNRSAYESLLASGEVLLVSPVLAQAIGLEPSLMFRQLAYWLDQNEKKQRVKLYQGERWWTFNSYQKWRDENFPFLSVSSIRRIFALLEDLGLVISTQKYNPSPMIQSKWYSIDVHAYNAFMGLWEAAGKPAAHETRPESRAAYDRFLASWQVAKANLPKQDIQEAIHGEQADSFVPHASNGFGAESNTQAESSDDPFIPPYWENGALSGFDQPFLSDEASTTVLGFIDAYESMPVDPVEQISIQVEQEDAQAEQSICSGGTSHLLNLSSPLKETIQETKTENQKETQKQEQKTIASQSEAYVPARFLKESQDSELQIRDASEVETTYSNTAGQADREFLPAKNGVETLGAKLLSRYTGSGLEDDESGFARSAGAQNSSAAAPAKTAGTKDSRSAQASQAQTSSARHSGQNTRSAGKTAAQKPGIATNSAAKAEPQTQALAAQKPGNATSSVTKTEPQTQALAAQKPGSAAQSAAKAEPQNQTLAAQKPGNATKPAAEAKPQTQAIAAQSQTASSKNNASGKAGQNSQRATKGQEAKRLQKPDGETVTEATEASPNLYTEVVRRVFSKPGELLKGESAFVGLWIGFFRGSLGKTRMKSHSSLQLSEEPMNPACILAFSLWYSERYQQDTLPRSPEILRARCDEFRALPNPEYWLQQGQARLEALITALAKVTGESAFGYLGSHGLAGSAPQAATKPGANSFSYNNAGKPIDESDMQDFDWKTFFEGVENNGH